MALDESPKRRRGRPPRIGLQNIIDAVLQGTGELTLAAVAGKLGTTPQALYHYVQSHSELVELVFHELVNKRVHPEPDGKDWVEYAFALGHFMAEAYNAVPGLADYSIGTPRKERMLYERWERLQEVGVAEGFDPLKTFWATQAVAEFVHGWFAREHRRKLGRMDGAPGEREIFAELVAMPGNPMPLTAQGFRLEETTTESRFDFMLRAFVLGLAQLAREGGLGKPETGPSQANDRNLEGQASPSPPRRGKAQPPHRKPIASAGKKSSSRGSRR